MSKHNFTEYQSNLSKVFVYSIVGLIIFLTGYWMFFLMNFKDVSKESKTNLTLENLELKAKLSNLQSGPLYDILEKEIIVVEGWKCVDYANYYNKTLMNKYNGGKDSVDRVLDIRIIKSIDLCNGLTLCNSYHKVILVGGYGQECILDQQTILCNTLIKPENFKE